MDIRYEHLKFVGSSQKDEEQAIPPKETLTENPVSAPTEKAFPPIQQELLEALSALFPEASPTLGESHDQLLWRGGQRSVVNWLRQEYFAQLKGAP